MSEDKKSTYINIKNEDEFKKAILYYHWPNSFLPYHYGKCILYWDIRYEFCEVYTDIKMFIKHNRQYWAKNIIKKVLW